MSVPSVHIVSSSYDTYRKPESHQLIFSTTSTQGLDLDHQRYRGAAPGRALGWSVRHGSAAGCLL